MKKVVQLFLSFVFIWVTLPAYSSTEIPDVAFADTKSWVKPLPLPKLTEQSNSGSVRYVLFDQQVDIRSDVQSQFFRYALQPTTEQGLTGVSQVEVRFSPKFEQLTFHRLEVIRDGEVFNKLDQTKLKVFQQEERLNENIYSENWIALFILEDIRVGDVVNYSYSIDGTNPVLGEKKFGSSPMSWSVAVDQTQFRLLTKAKQQPQIKVFNSTAKVNREKTEHGIEYSVAQNHVQAEREEDSAPSWYTPFAYVVFSEYQNWSEVNDWAKALYLKDLTLPPALKEIMAEYQGENTLASLAKMVHWVQNSIRYFGIEMGINSHMPSTPLETFTRRYGDCKDKTILLIALLEHMGIEAYPALVSDDHYKSDARRASFTGCF